MFDFLKRAIGMAGAYSAGKAYEQSYKLAQLSTIIYLHKQCAGDDGERMATCVWSYQLPLLHGTHRSRLDRVPGAMED